MGDAEVLAQQDKKSFHPYCGGTRAVVVFLLGLLVAFPLSGTRVCPSVFMLCTVSWGGEDRKTGLFSSHSAR